MDQGKYGNPFSATINGILDLFRKKERVGRLDEGLRMDGKTCLITGANSGLGFAVARQLAERGARVLMACRSGIPDAGEAVRRASGNPDVHMLPVDLSRRASIEALVEALKARGEHLDVVVFNAAMVPGGSRRTEDGFDAMFMVNYLAKFILANALIDQGLLRQESGLVPRLIFVSSESHRTRQAIDIDRLGVYEEYSMGKVIGLYGYYKLVLNTFAAELGRRLNPNGKTNVAVHALCPGPVNSNIAREAPGWAQPLLKGVFGLFFAAPMKAAEPVLYLACAPELEGRPHAYVHLMQEKEMDVKALDPEMGKRLWARSEVLLAQPVNG
jgi:NAD(P)-dependent dehydrogenase (short-subunit alcohol dehydrogenase family)